MAPASMMGETKDGIDAGASPSPMAYIRKVPRAARAMSVTRAAKAAMSAPSFLPKFKPP